MIEKEERYYDTPYGRLPSVTTILSILSKPALIVWTAKTTAEYFISHLNEIKDKKIEITDEYINNLIKQAKQEHQNLSNEAKNIGSITHHAIEIFIKTTKIPEIEHPEAKKSFNAFLEWSKQNNFIPLIAEQTVYSKLGYAGTLDCVAKLNDRIYVIDFKTSNAFYEEYALQISAYAYAYSEMTSNNIQYIGILRLDKTTGLPHFKDYSEEQEKCFKMFKCLLEFYQLKKELKNGI